MTETHITLAHGNGGRLMRELIDSLFVPAFSNDELNTQADAASMKLAADTMMTTDSYTVEPLFFPGGDIGKLSVCGTVNDLIVSGALPRYMSVNFLIEEGFALAELNVIVDSMATEARNNNLHIITGDTKVLPRGTVNGIYIVTTGIGEQINQSLSIQSIQAGDQIFVSGTIGDHATAILLAREQYGLQGKLKSDCASLLQTGTRLMHQDGIKFMRDPTRGGLAAVCYEIIHSNKLGITLFENNIPIRDEVQTFCDVLGFNPYYLACEGRVVFVTTSDIDIDEIKSIDSGIRHIGEVTANDQSLLLQTRIGGTRIIPELESDPLPRIC